MCGISGICPYAMDKGRLQQKKRLNYDIVQIGWVGQGLKPHFFKNRNMDKGKVRVVQNPICSCSKKLVLQEKRCIFSNFCNYSVSFCGLILTCLRLGQRACQIFKYLLSIYLYILTHHICLNLICPY